jgi:transforming growth factor-beta-induced protein
LLAHRSAVVHTISQVLVPTLPKSIFDTAVSAGLTTLSSLLTQAGLAPTFSAPGSTPNYTVFAPTNAAFGGIPAPLVDWLTNPRAINAAALSNTLKFHALSGVVFSSAIPAGGTPITTLCTTCTPALSAFNEAGVVTVRSGTTVLATVATPNVTCTNGVVHVIGAVLVPGNQSIPTLDVVQTALGVPALSNLTNALVATGLVPALTIGPSTPSFTVFAPLNSGWSGVPASVASNLALLSSVLQYHVIVGRVYAADLPVGVAVVRATLGGQTLSLVRSANNTVAITSATGNVATVVTADIDTSK